MEWFQTLLQDGLPDYLGFVFLIAFVILVFSLQQREKNKLYKVAASWLPVAQVNGLECATHSVTYAYGSDANLAMGNMLLGSAETFNHPCMVGTNYRGYKVAVRSNMGSTRADRLHWVLEAWIFLEEPKPSSVLAYKRGFESLDSKRIPKTTKTGLSVIDRDFKVRSEDINFVCRVFENLALAEKLKAEGFKNAEIIFDGDQLKFCGLVGKNIAKPEQAIALVNILCEVAEAAA